jgi:hypothetical protein
MQFLVPSLPPLKTSLPRTVCLLGVIVFLVIGVWVRIHPLVLTVGAAAVAVLVTTYGGDDYPCPTTES